PVASDQSGTTVNRALWSARNRSDRSFAEDPLRSAAARAQEPDRGDRANRGGAPQAARAEGAVDAAMLLRAGIRRGSLSHRRADEARARARGRAAFRRDLPGLYVRIRAGLLLSRRRPRRAEDLAAGKSTPAASGQCRPPRR